MTDCIFCQIAAGEMGTEFIYQDEHLVVFKDISPKARIHLLVVTRKHIESLAHLQQEDADLMAHIIMTLPKIADVVGLTSGFRTIVNTGRGGGQEIDHLHFHLLAGEDLPGF